MISTWISRASAITLGALGLTLIFASDDVLPRLVSGYPMTGAWVGQLLGAAWFAVVYVWLLFRGPFERDFEMQRSASDRRP